MKRPCWSLAFVDYSCIPGVQDTSRKSCLWRLNLSHNEAISSSDRVHWAAYRIVEVKGGLFGHRPDLQGGSAAYGWGVLVVLSQATLE